MFVDYHNYMSLELNFSIQYDVVKLLHNDMTQLRKLKNVQFLNLHQRRYNFQKKIVNQGAWINEHLKKKMHCSKHYQINI